MIRSAIAVAVLLLAASCASAPPPAASSGSSAGAWRFNYDSATGVASALQSEPGGPDSVAVTCRAPDGDMIVADYRLASANVSTVDFTVRQETIRVPAARGQGPDGRPALTVRLPRRPPNLGAYPSADGTVSLNAGGVTHTYARGSVEKFWQVAQACWPSGS
ncbi:MAG: hypothetical protein GC189_05915 [Alphaproteobacteria bacterium]|nr:hypothetical protein [Alphaproteobacteria bacterium]